MVMASAECEMCGGEPFQHAACSVPGCDHEESCPLCDARAERDAALKEVERLRDEVTALAKENAELREAIERTVPPDTCENYDHNAPSCPKSTLPKARWC